VWRNYAEQKAYMTIMAEYVHWYRKQGPTKAVEMHYRGSNSANPNESKIVTIDLESLFWKGKVFCRY